MPFLPSAKARLDVGPADEGRRLSTRFTEGLGKPESEATGVLLRWSGGLSDGILRLRRRDGIERGVPADQLVAARVIPPELSAYAVQRMCQQLRHVPCLPRAHQGHACFITGRLESQNQQAHGAQV